MKSQFYNVFYDIVGDNEEIIKEKEFAFSENSFKEAEEFAVRDAKNILKVIENDKKLKDELEKIKKIIII